ncbi:MAG: alpha/beta fold hydrolase [Actinomycetota bacterium]|nr:alpha/beta fold hydrolase [Actinomycetota bacterium]
MRWEEAGEGTPVVFLHGIPTSPRLWRHVVPKVRGARSMAWEMVGYGASIPEGRDKDISVVMQARYLALWMREVGLGGGAVVVGHDLGGGVAQVLAVRNPELVRGLVLMNCISYDSWPIAPVRAIRTAGPLFGRMPASAFRHFYAALLRGGHDDRGRWRESVSEHLPFYEEAGGPETLVRQARSLNVRDTLGVAAQIPHLDVPARLVWGAADAFQPIGYGYRLAYEIGGSMERIEGGRHFVPEDHPDEVAAAVNGLLKQMG